MFPTGIPVARVCMVNASYLNIILDNYGIILIITYVT